MLNLVRTLSYRDYGEAGSKAGLDCEWLVTNGLGGYASGTVLGVPTRRYHGLLNAALPAPLGRAMMLAQLSERLALPDGSYASLGFDDLAEGAALSASGTGYLSEFRLEAGLPRWCFEVGNVVVEKRLLLPHLQNTSYVTFCLREGDDSIRLYLRPWSTSDHTTHRSTRPIPDRTG